MLMEKAIKEINAIMPDLLAFSAFLLVNSGSISSLQKLAES